MENIKYCPKCAHIEYLFAPPENCKFCDHSLMSVEFTYIEFCNTLKQQGYSPNDALKIFEERYITGNPEFSEDAKQARIHKKNRELAEIENYKAPNKVTCQYCQSTNVKKISVGGRAVSVGLFGLASQKIGKQWHCNECKSDF